MEWCDFSGLTLVFVSFLSPPGRLLAWNSSPTGKDYSGPTGLTGAALLVLFISPSSQLPDPITLWPHLLVPLVPPFPSPSLPCFQLVFSPAFCFLLLFFFPVWMIKQVCILIILKFIKEILCCLSSKLTQLMTLLKRKQFPPLKICDTDIWGFHASNRFSSSLDTSWVSYNSVQSSHCLELAIGPICTWLSPTRLSSLETSSHIPSPRPLVLPINLAINWVFPWPLPHVWWCSRIAVSIQNFFMFASLL